MQARGLVEVDIVEFVVAVGDAARSLDASDVGLDRVAGEVGAVQSSAWAWWCRLLSISCGERNRCEVKMATSRAGRHAPPAAQWRHVSDLSLVGVQTQ